MSNISTIVTIRQTVVGILDAIQSSQQIYKQTVDFMDSMEIDSGLSGTQKKAAVLDKMREILLGENQDWERWKLALSNFIDEIKTTFNKFKALFMQYA